MIKIIEQENEGKPPQLQEIVALTEKNTKEIKSPLALKMGKSLEYKEHYDWFNGQSIHSSADSEYAWSGPYAEVKKLEPRDCNQVYYMTYAVSENRAYNGKGNRKEKMCIKFGDDLHCEFIIPPYQDDEYFKKRDENNQHWMRERFARMNPILKSTVINGLSINARTMLKKILGEK